MIIYIYIGGTEKVAPNSPEPSSQDPIAQDPIAQDPIPQVNENSDQDVVPTMPNNETETETPPTNLALLYGISSVPY